MVLQKIGLSKPEIDGVLEDFRRQYMEDGGDINDDTFDFLEAFRRRLPSSEPEMETLESKDLASISSELVEAGDATAEDVRLDSDTLDGKHPVIPVITQALGAAGENRDHQVIDEAGSTIHA